MKKILVVIALVVVFLVPTQMIRAGESTRFSSSDKRDMVNTFVREFFGLLEERQETKQKQSQYNASVAEERIRKEREIGEEKIREKRDVSREAIRKDKPTTVVYTRNGETITVDISRPEKDLRNENERLEQAIRNAELRRRLQEIENNINRGN